MKVDLASRNHQIAIEDNLPYYEYYELDKCEIVFIDNILIYSQSREEHADHLRIVLGKLGEHRMLLS